MCRSGRLLCGLSASDVLLVGKPRAPHFGATRVLQHVHSATLHECADASNRRPVVRPPPEWSHKYLYLYLYIYVPLVLRESPPPESSSLWPCEQSTSAKDVREVSDGLRVALETLKQK